VHGFALRSDWSDEKDKKVRLSCALSSLFVLLMGLGRQWMRLSLKV